MKPNAYIYDLEVYPNIFTFCGKFKDSDEIQLYEISDRMNERDKLINWLGYLANSQSEMVGFNNIGYDYYFIHELLTNPYLFTYSKAFQISQQIIVGGGLKPIWMNKRLIPQIDILKFLHFDNKAKRTSLKALQFAMRSPSVEDLPFDIRPLNDQEKNKLREYNVHDVKETERFYKLNEHHVDMRREYVNEGLLFGDVLNFSDVKIGTETLIKRLGKENTHRGSKPRQSIRTSIEFNKIILPKIYFRTETYNEVLEWYKSQVFYVGKANNIKLYKNLAGLKFVYGIGGVHASAENRIYETTETHQIIDIDVAGMYVAVAIANRFAPEHLGQAYVHAYSSIKEERARYPKGSPRNAAFKLAGNGAYGNSNNPFSCFYDPQYTYSVTVNGQLQITQLVEMIDLIPDCELIQANTDGITVRVNKQMIPLFNMWCREWEKMTGLELEEVLYNRMFIRDVNNYFAEKMDGSLKRKGAYEYPTCLKDYDGWWNKNYSNLASKKAAEKAMTHKWPIETAIRLVTDPFDFMLRYKATGGAKLFIGDEPQQKTTRYYVSTKGGKFYKVSTPTGEIGQYKKKSKLKPGYYEQVMKEIGPNVWDERIHTKNKSKYEKVVTGINTGYLVKECNRAEKFSFDDLDWNFYIEEAKKLIIGSH